MGTRGEREFAKQKFPQHEAASVMESARLGVPVHSLPLLQEPVHPLPPHEAVHMQQHHLAEALIQQDFTAGVTLKQLALQQEANQRLGQLKTQLQSLRHQKQCTQVAQAELQQQHHQQQHFDLWTDHQQHMQQVTTSVHADHLTGPMSVPYQTWQNKSPSTASSASRIDNAYVEPMLQ